MKKFSKIGKRLIALFLVAFMNINTFATSASNDGTDFVTKAEFDSMIKDFNDQMNEYQSGLNAKIDNAISNYLAGMSSTYSSSTEPLFITNAGSENVAFMSNNAVGYKKHTTGYNFKVMYGVLFYKSEYSQIFGKHAYWTESKTAGANGQRIIVTQDGSNYRFKGVATDYSETFDMNWTKIQYDVDDGFVDGDKYLYPVAWNGTQDAIFSVGSSTWNSWQTTIMHTLTASSLKPPSAQVFDPKINDYTLKYSYYSCYSDNPDTTKVYRFLEGNLTKFIANSTFSETNSVFHNGNSYGSKQCLYMLGYPDYPGYFWNTCNSAASSNFTGITTILNKYIPTSAPVEKDGCKWSNILYNDDNTYTYNYQSSPTATPTTKTLKNYSMVAGVPFTAVEKGETLKWTYAFTAASDGRRLYLKYGVFDGTTTMTGDDIEVYDASSQTNTIEFKAKKSDIIFIKWTAGSTMVSANCSKISRQMDQ